jgi:hypothetical protein
MARRKYGMPAVVMAVILTLGAAVLGDAPRSDAGAGPNTGPVQNFSINSSICYGAAPTSAVVCPAGTDTAVGAGASGTEYGVTRIEPGSRLSAPISYTPGDFTATPVPPLTAVGSITALTDILCDGGNDVLSAGSPDNPNDPHARTGNESAGTLGTWPSATNWAPYPVVHQGAAPSGPDAYLNTSKPTPSTFIPVTHAKSGFYTLWLGGSIVLDLTGTGGGQPTPLNVIVEESPYTADLRVQVAILAGSPAPPTNSFSTCIDTPQHTVGASTQVVTPVTPGLYARWTLSTSARDLRSGTQARIIDLHCVNVGGFAANDTDADCLQDASAGGTDANDTNADQDGDLVVDGIEAEFGTSLTAADSDGDGANDYVEMAHFTRAFEGGAGFLADCDAGGPITNNNADDTDCDGQLDLPENGADANAPATKNVYDDNATDDNCPTDANPTQLNSDSDNAPNFAASGDLSIPDQDVSGDPCDGDDDNDGVGDVVEGAMFLGAGPNFCTSTVGTPLVTSGLDSDSDNDLALDGLECKFASRPDKANNPDGRVVTSSADFLADGDVGSVETFYRTQRINIPAGGQTDDLDSDGLCGGKAAGAGCAGGQDNDSDEDRLLDGIEVLFYGTQPSNDDTDGDGCKDGSEAADVNGDRTISVLDLSAVATRSASTPFAGGRYRDLPTGTGAYTTVDYVDLDFNRDGSLSVVDLSAIAGIQGIPAFGGNCGGVNPGAAQGGITVSNANTSPQP